MEDRDTQGTCIVCGRSFRGGYYDNVCSDNCHSFLEWQAKVVACG